jgi:serine/threonine protein kinase
MSALPQQVDLPPRYRVVRHIANGGMATVWAAEDAVLERLVAVKVLAAGYAADPSARKRFTREARAAARVSDHNNVVTIFDIGEMPSPPAQAFIVMEHFAGGTVADRLRVREPGAAGIPVPLALRWLRETASALDAAHAADIVHRDVKPGNLLLDENGRLAVGDFGIASLAGETAVTAAGQVLGTAAYLSPEQAHGRPATPASDRYSLAVVAFELLCGRRPFDGDTPMAQARARVDGEPAVATGACAAAGDVLTWGLAREARDRPASALAFVAALDGALGDEAQPTRVLPHRALGTDWTDGSRFAREPAPAHEARDATAGHEAQPITARDAPARREVAPAARRDPLVTPRRETAATAQRELQATPRREVAPTPAARREPLRREPPPDPVARRRNPHRKAYMLAGLAATCLAVGAGAALIGDDGNNGGRDATAPRAASSKPQGSAAVAPKQSAPSSPTKTAAAQAPRAGAGASSTAPAGSQPSSGAPSDTATAPDDGRSAAAINDAGYALLPDNPQSALPLLARAVEKFRAQGDTSSTDYAYALYNYGWALRLAGRPAEAIPLLQERLTISNYKRGIVRKELETAEQAAGG